MADNQRWMALEQIVALNGGVLVGKTRLQKTIYLLQSKGLNIGYDFEYHHYGPYSEGVAEDIKWAEFLGQLTGRPEMGFHDVPYTVFETKSLPPNSILGSSSDAVKSILGILEKHSAVVLELAATLLFLRKNGYATDSEEELKVRKPSKAAPERLEKARGLLRELNLGT
jgi:uncharacterized protein